MHRFGYLFSLVNLYKGWRKLGIKVGIRLEHSYWECLCLQADDGGPNSQVDYDLRIDSGKRIFLLGFFYEIAPPPSAFPRAAGTGSSSAFTGNACIVSGDHVRRGLAILMIKRPLIVANSI